MTLFSLLELVETGTVTRPADQAEAGRRKRDRTRHFGPTPSCGTVEDRLDFYGVAPIRVEIDFYKPRVVRAG